VKASDKLTEVKKEEADELYSPVTRDKINNADSGVLLCNQNVSSPLGDLMNYRKKKIDQAKKTQKTMEGISMKPVDEKASP